MDSVLFSFLRLNRLRKQRMRALLRPIGFSGSMVLLLQYIANHPETSQEDAAVFYYLDKTNVARDAGRLEKLGLICRSVVPENRRQYAMSITGEGRAALEQLNTVYNTLTEQMSLGFTAEEWKLFGSLLEKAEKNLIMEESRQTGGKHHA